MQLPYLHWTFPVQLSGRGGRLPPRDPELSWTTTPEKVEENTLYYVLMASDIEIVAVDIKNAFPEILSSYRQMKFLHSQSQYHKIIFIRIITEKSHYWVYRTCALKKFTIF